jgi:hypothetical protein
MSVSHETSLVLGTILAAAATLAAAPRQARAAIIYGDTADCGIYHSSASIPPTILAGNSENYAEIGINGGLERNLVLVFKLPDRPAGQQVSTANLSVSVNYNNNGSPVDLYGLHWRSSSTVTTGDYYAGPSDPNASLIQQTLLDGSSPANYARTDTNAAADAALADYLNAQYDDGAAAGDYVFLRLNRHDTSTGPFSMIAVYSADIAPFLANAFSGGSPTLYNYYLNLYEGQMSPTLDLTFAPATSVPEPASLSLLALGALAMLHRRRRTN